jgi:phosphatidylinositol-3-phosphatase
MSIAFVSGLARQSDVPWRRRIGVVQTWVPRILGSPAWSEGSLLVITFDEASSSDASACCGERPGPNSTNPGGTTIGPGGGRTGALLISQYVQPGSVNDTPYNHYSLRRSIEDVFGLGHLDNLRPPRLMSPTDARM